MTGVKYKAYPSRFYVLIVTALLAIQQNIAWLTFGPITSQAKAKFGLTDAELTILPQYSPIAFVFLTVPFTWFLHRYGLRISGVGGAWILAVGCTIRVFIPFVPHAQRWIWVMHLGHILIGLVVMGIVLNPSSGFNNHVAVHSVDEFFYSIAYIGSISTIVGTIMGQVTGFFADRFQQRFKLILLLLLTPATLVSLWFSLSIYGFVSQNPINYFFSFTLINVFTLSAFPIFYEAIVETTYPVPEGTSTGFLALSTNAATLLFGIIGLANVFSDAHPERAKAMTWVMTGLSALATLLVLAFRDKYHRLAVDKNLTTPKHTGIQAIRDTASSPLLIETK